MTHPERTYALQWSGGFVALAIILALTGGTASVVYPLVGYVVVAGNALYGRPYLAERKQRRTETSPSDTRAR